MDDKRRDICYYIGITPAPNSSKNFAGQNPIRPSISTRKMNYCYVPK